MKILIIEDDPHILLGLEEILRGEGYEVAVSGRGDEALSLVRQHSPDLLILDVMLPGKSGYEVCRQLRTASCNVPIVMLTAKGQEIDKVVGLELGADDYVTKPFGVRELLARIQAVVRRSSRALSTERQDGVFKIGIATIDSKQFKVHAGGSGQPITVKELKLLQFFHEHAGEVLSRDRLLNEVWGYNYYGTTRTLDQVIAQLRRKIGDNGHEPRYLLTVYGVGYKLQLDTPDAASSTDQRRVRVSANPGKKPK